MIPKIEDCENPLIGDNFMVRTVKFKRNDSLFEWPVVAESHRDGQHGLDKIHYHVDWRFVPQHYIDEHREYFGKVYPGAWKNAKNTEYFVPVLETEVVEKGYKEWEYLRDFEFPIGSFSSLEIEMKERGCKMKKMRCPHHGTNLTSCKPVNNIVTCPQHGLRWNIITGELVI